MARCEVRREANRLRFLSLHLAMEGLLALQFGQLIWQYVVMGGRLARVYATVDESKIHYPKDLREGVQELREDWAQFSRTLAAGLTDIAVTSQKVYKAGPFTLERFISEQDSAREHHIAESTLGPDGSLQYLKTFRLSTVQTKQGYSLRRLAESEGRITKLAGQLKISEAELLLQF